MDSRREPSVPAGGATPTIARVLLYQLVGICLVLLAGFVAFYFWHQGYYFYSTDDAMVSGKLTTVVSARAGTVLHVHFRLGQYVLAGQSIATLTTDCGATFDATSPLNGRIIEETALPGEVVTAGEMLAQVVDLGSVYITAYVEETHIRDVHLGQGVDVWVNAYGDRKLHGTVTLIVPITAGETSPLPTTDYASGNFTSVTQRIPVQITLADPEGLTLYPGESAHVTIHIHD